MYGENCAFRGTHHKKLDIFLPLCYYKEKSLGRNFMISGYPIWVVLLIGCGVFCASFVDAIGGGGGIISVPVYLLAGLPTHFALGTNKLSSGIGTAASTIR